MSHLLRKISIQKKLKLYINFRTIVLHTTISIASNSRSVFLSALALSSRLCLINLKLFRIYGKAILSIERSSIQISLPTS